MELSILKPLLQRRQIAYRRIDPVWKQMVGLMIDMLHVKRKRNLQPVSEHFPKKGLHMGSFPQWHIPRLPPLDHSILQKNRSDAFLHPRINGLPRAGGFDRGVTEIQRQCHLLDR